MDWPSSLSWLHQQAGQKMHPTKAQNIEYCFAMREPSTEAVQYPGSGAQSRHRFVSLFIVPLVQEGLRPATSSAYGGAIHRGAP
jgi:hypothetical protein